MVAAGENAFLGTWNYWDPSQYRENLSKIKHCE